MSNTSDFNDLALRGRELAQAARAQTAGTAAGAVLGKAGYGAPSTMEPSTPPSSAITKTVPGGIDAVPQYEGQQFGSGKTTVPPATASAGQLEESEYHQPYSRDIHHGEVLFPGYKGHEVEEYEQAEEYASPDDAKPELKARVEEMERKADWSPAHGTTTTSQGPKAGFPAETARDTEEKAVGEGSQEHVHGIVETVKEALEQPIEAGRRAAQVTVERVTQAVQAAKERMGLTEDATRETTTGTSTTTTTSPSPVADTVREKAARVVTVTRSAAAEAAAGVQRVTAEVLATAKASVAQMPSTVSDMYERGKQLAEEKDKAAAEASKDTPPFQVMAKTKEGDEEEVLVPSAASLAQRAKPVHAQQQQRSEEQEGTTGPGIEAFSSGGKETAQMQSAQEIQQQVGSGSKVIGEVGRKPLPVPQEQWDQSAPKGSTGRVSKPYDSPITLTPSSGGGNVQPGGREWDVGTKDPVDAAKQVGATGWRG